MPWLVALLVLAARRSRPGRSSNASRRAVRSPVSPGRTPGAWRPDRRSAPCSRSPRLGVATGSIVDARADRRGRQPGRLGGFVQRRAARGLSLSARRNERSVSSRYGSHAARSASLMRRGRSVAAVDEHDRRDRARVEHPRLDARRREHLVADLEARAADVADPQLDVERLALVRDRGEVLDLLAGDERDRVRARARVEHRRRRAGRVLATCRRSPRTPGCAPPRAG